MGLRRQDLNLQLMVVQVRRQLRKVGGTYSVSPPKNREGTNDVTIPEALREVCEHHLKLYSAKRPEGYLFTRQTGERHVSETSLYQHWVKARKAVGRSDLRFHDLRKTCATMVAEAGGTIADVMERLRDKTPDSVYTSPTELSQRMFKRVVSVSERLYARNHPRTKQAVYA
jgi:integrase